MNPVPNSAPAPVASTPSVAVSTRGVNIMSKMKSVATPSNITFWIASILFIVFFVIGFVRLSSFAGDKEDWNDLKPKITEILIYTLVATFAFCIAALLYFIQDTQKAIYFSIIVSSLSLGLAYSGLVIGCITR